MNAFRDDGAMGPHRRGCVLLAALQVVWAACVFWPAPALAAEEPLEERFLKEAPEKWLEYRRIVARHAEVRYNRKLDISVGGETVLGGVSETLCVLKVDGKQASVRAVKSENGKPKAVEAFNPQYRFELKPGRGDRWVLDHFRAGATAVPDDLIGRHATIPLLMGEDSTLGAAMENACAGQLLRGAWLPRMAESPHFQLKRATLVGNQGLVKVEFTFEPEERTGGRAAVRSGMAVLDPKRYWLICEASTETSNMFASKEGQILDGVRGMLTLKNTLTQAKMAVPYVSRQVLTETCDKYFGGKTWKLVWEATIELRDVPEMDEKQFRLSGYDLPEPAKK